MRPQGFPARLRIKQRRDFLRVQQTGHKHHMRNFLVFVAPRSIDLHRDESLPTRIGITVTRKIGNAVVRNRIKRLLREVFRRERLRLPEGLDVVFVAKQQARDLAYADVAADFEALVRRARPKGRA